MMIAADFADTIRSAMKFPSPTSSQLLGWASGLIKELSTNGVVNFLPGTVIGSTSPGGSLSEGAATGGVILGLSGPSLASLVMDGAKYPGVSPQLSGQCSALTQYLMTGLVVFSPGGITGTCTNSAHSPGPLVNGAGQKGKITALSGSALASLTAPMMGYSFVSGALLNQSNAIINYIMNNAEVSFSSGTVEGTCPAGGGPLSAGIAAGGKIQ